MADISSTKPTQQQLNQAQAVNILIQAVRIAQSKGAYTLEDAELISQAIKVFIPPETEKADSKEDPIVNKEPVDNTEEPTGDTVGPITPVVKKNS